MVLLPKQVHLQKDVGAVARLAFVEIFMGEQVVGRAAYMRPEQWKERQERQRPETAMSSAASSLRTLR
jgi:hypothetical protein